MHSGADEGGTAPAPSTSPTRLPTMRDIADHLGVSRQLVSLVMRGAPGPSEQSRERILDAARDLGYRPNTSARLLRQNRTRLIGVLFELRHPFEVRFVERLLVRAADEGFSLVLGPVTSEHGIDAAVASLVAQRVEAIVAFNPDPASSGLDAALDLVPVVWLGERSVEPRADNVSVDERTGLRLAVEHLAGLGHREISYVGGQAGVVGPDRVAAYRAAMAGVGLDERIDVLDGDFTEEGGATAARRVLARPRRPTALICGGDLSAIGALAVFSHAGLSVPGDISVVGFDDSYVAALSYNELTSVRQDVEATVEATLAIVLARVADRTTAPRAVLTPTVLVERASSGPAPATA